MRVNLWYWHTINRIDNDTVLELFGFELLPPTLTPEMSYADIAAVVALVVTAFTFGFSIWQWNKKSKSEQFKMAREMRDKIELKINEFTQFHELNRDLLSAAKRSESANVRANRFRRSMDFLMKISSVLNEMYEFTWFVEKGEISDKKVINYFGTHMQSRTSMLMANSNAVEKALELHRPGPVYVDGFDYFPSIKILIEGVYVSIKHIEKIWHFQVNELLDKPLNDLRPGKI